VTGAGPPTDAELLALEHSHLLPEVRRSAVRMRELLADDFVEFGSSGAVHDRDAVIRSLAGERNHRAAIDGFSVQLRSPDAALTTYRLASQSENAPAVRWTLRSSLWVRRDGRWQLLFHQGTPTTPSA
jgi:hypothetical protein